MAENPRPHSQYGNRSDRGPRFYSRVFDYGKRGENLNGQKILVVGAGDDTFADKLGDKAMIVRIDPEYRNLPPDNPNMAYAEFSQNLPHQTWPFYVTVALCSTRNLGGKGR